MSLIRLDNVSKFYKSEETVSVGMKKISLEFNLGEFVAVTGESGSGKSTLLNVVSGLDGYEDGELYLFDEETSHYTIADWERYRGAYVGFVFQNYNIIDAYTVYQNVVLALEVQGYDHKSRRKRALELIEQVGLTSHKNHKASKLSGGQKQRAVIARALAKDCPIIVADEPTGNLDSASSEQIIKLLRDISKDKLVVIVTHDYDQVKDVATRKIKMHDGEVVEDKKIKSYEKATLKTDIKIKQMHFMSLLRFAFRNLFSTPRKLLFMLLLQILVITVFTIVYTNQISGIREIGLEQSRTYPNVPQTRLLVERRDGQPFTTDDISYLEDMRYVRYVYEDSSNFFNQMDFFLEGSFGGWYYVRGTDTVKILSTRDIDGRLPEAKNEVVISNYYNNFSIGDTVSLTSGYNPITNTPNVLASFTVVGIDKLDRQIIYFSDAFINDVDEQEIVIDQQLYNYNFDNFTYGLRTEIDDNEYVWVEGVNPITGADGAIGDNDSGTIESLTLTFSATSVRGRQVEVTRTLNIRVSEGEKWNLRINRTVLDDIVQTMMEIIEPEYTIVPRNIASVSVDGYFGGTQVINRIDNERFKVYYPANISSALREFLVFFLSLIALVFLSLFGIFLYSIVHAVTRNIMNARKKDFAIFRSIGANQKILARLVVLEQVILSAVGFVITIIILNLVGDLIPMLSQTLQYMRASDFAILLFAFLGFGAWLGLRFNKKVFGQSVIETLSMSKGE
ncbi:MAG: ATP-binding cassette domain-containing protein [Acholeplasmataceae bacterium]